MEEHGRIRKILRLFSIFMVLAVILLPQLFSCNEDSHNDAGLAAMLFSLSSRNEPTGNSVSPGCTKFAGTIGNEYFRRVYFNSDVQIRDLNGDPIDKPTFMNFSFNSSSQVCGE